MLKPRQNARTRKRNKSFRTTITMIYMTYAEEDKFRVQLSLHDYNGEQKAIKYWSDITKISPNQFLKINYIVSKYSQKLRKNKLPFGTIQIRICDVKLFHKIMGWIQGVSQQIDKMPG